MEISRMPKLIDVSRWQGRIDWRTVKNNVSAAIIKIGGSDDGFYMDSQAHRNLIEARSYKLPIGTYFFLGGVHSSSEEAQYIINVFNDIGGLKSGEPFVLDWERRRPGLNEVNYLCNIVDKLMDKGFPPPLIYMNLHYVTSQDWRPLVKRGCRLWLASWGDNDAKPEKDEIPGSQEWPRWSIWQYSSTGSVPGIAGRVDMNLLNGTIEAFKSWGSKGGVRIPGTTPPVPHNLPNQGKFSDYNVVKGDTLTKIGQRYGKTWQQIYALNRDRISNPNRIYIGQKLRIPTTTHNNPQLPTTTQRPKTKYHEVQNGENLSVIASKYGLDSWRTLYRANMGVIGSDPNLIKPGQKLRIP